MNAITRRTVRIALPTAVAATLLGGGVALAAGSSATSSSTTYTGCLSRYSGVPYHVKTTGSPAPRCFGRDSIISWNAQGPQGVPGLAGSAGPAGPAGPAGATGATGATGPQGAKGDTGDVGLAGATGPAGPQGPKGDAGATGPQGPAGTSGIAGYNVVRNTITDNHSVTGHDFITVNVSCPGTQRAVGGGADATNFGAVMYRNGFDYNQPAGTETVWHASWRYVTGIGLDSANWQYTAYVICANVQ